jgi:hypothetical protein
MSKQGLWAQAASRVVDLRQCALVCDSPPIARAMTEAADWIEHVLRVVPAQDIQRELEVDEMMAALFALAGRNGNFLAIDADELPQRGYSLMRRHNAEGGLEIRIDHDGPAS